MRRLWTWLLCLSLLMGLLPVLPAEASELLEQELDLLLQEHDLAKADLSLSFYDTADGESYRLAADRMIPAGKLWMLPLHMYFCEQDSLGAYEPSNELLEEEFRINGLNLKECRYQSVTLGKEEVAMSMRDYLGGNQNFKVLVNEAFGHLDQALLTQDFLSGNCFSPDFWMNCLRELTDHPEVYDDLSRNYSMIQTKDALAGFSRSSAVFQICGEEEGWLTAIAKVWADSAYLLVASVPAEAGAKAFLADLNDLIYSYVSRKESSHTATLPSSEAHDLSIHTGNTDHRQQKLRWMGFAVGGLIVVVALVAIPLWLRRRKGEEEYYD